MHFFKAAACIGALILSGQLFAAEEKLELCNSCDSKEDYVRAVLEKGEEGNFFVINYSTMQLHNFEVEKVPLSDGRTKIIAHEKELTGDVKDILSELKVLNSEMENQIK